MCHPCSYRACLFCYPYAHAAYRGGCRAVHGHQPHCCNETGHRAGGPHDATCAHRRHELVVQRRYVFDVERAGAVRGPVGTAVCASADTRPGYRVGTREHRTCAEGDEGFVCGEGGHELGGQSFVAA